MAFFRYLVPKVTNIGVKQLFGIQFSRGISTSSMSLRSRASTSTAVERDQEINNVVVVGGGSMGSGIALVAAQNDFHVEIVDKEDEYLQKCEVMIRRSLERVVEKKFPDEPRSAAKFVSDTLSNIHTSTDPLRAVQNADIVIEAITEDLKLKQDLFRDLDSAAPRKTIFASNTTSLSISEIAKATNRQDKFGGLHFNPVLMMQLVEVIRCPQTSNETFKKLYDFGKGLGKTPIVCQDTPGFVVNRLLVPYILEAIRLLERGHAALKDIDHAMKLGAGYQMGPFGLADELGLDLVKAVADELYRQEPDNALFKPCHILNNMVEMGKLGWKTEEGFYDYNVSHRK